MEPSEASLIPENPSKSQNDAELGHPSSLSPPPSNDDPDSAPSDLHHAEDVKLLSEELRDLYLKEQQEAVLELGLIGNEKKGINGGEENMIGYGSENGNDSENEVGNGVDEVIEKKDGGFIARNYQYPVRPEAEDCAFYMKTGTCKFGSNCKFNHPLRRKTNLVVKERLKQATDPFERPEQIECKYYFTSGGCKYGSSCRYNHTKAKNSAAPAILELNFVGLPVRQGEKECPYYMRTGSCKYGVNCRFNHPDPTVGGSDTSPGFTNGGPVPLQGASQSNAASWSGPRSLNDTYQTAPFVPLMLSPTQGVTSQNTDWNGYHQTPAYVQERSLPLTLPLPLPPAYVMNNPATRTNIYTQYPPQQQVDEFPERPGQPECSYYLKTGDCKFKSNCRYHHPKNRTAVPPPCSVSDKGLPLRPDKNICSFYSRYGICKFGPACKFNHPDQPDFVLDHELPYGDSAMMDGHGTTGSGHRSDSSIEQLL